MTTATRSTFWRFWNQEPGFKPFYDDDTMRSVLWRLARGDNGALEIQGIVTFRAPKYEQQVADLLTNRDPAYPFAALLQLESPMRPSQKQDSVAMKYAHEIKAPIKGCDCEVCAMRLGSGDGAWHERGDPYVARKPDKKAKLLDDIEKDLREGVEHAEMMKRYKGFITRCPAGYYALKEAINTEKITEKKWEMPVVYFLKGSPAAGKTYLATKIFEELGVKWYLKAPENKWWCGYDYEEGVMISEFEGQNPKDGMSHNYMKNLLDGPPIRVEPKGTSILIRPRLIIITSNKDIVDWWPGLDAINVEAMLRRIAFYWRESPCGWIHKNELCDCADKGIPVTPLRGVTKRPLKRPFAQVMVHQAAAQPHAFVALDFRNPKHAHSAEAAQVACATPVPMEQDNRDPYGSYADIAAVEEQMQVEAFFMDKAADAAMMELDTSRMRFSPPR